MDMVPKFNIPLNHNMTLLSQKKKKQGIICVMDSIGLCNNKTSFGHNKRLNVYKSLIIYSYYYYFDIIPFKTCFKIKEISKM